MNKLPTVGDILDELDGATAAPAPALTRQGRRRNEMSKHPSCAFPILSVAALAALYPARVRMADGSEEPSIGFIWRLERAFPSYSDEAVLSAARHYASRPETPLVLDMTPDESGNARCVRLTPDGRELLIAWLDATLDRPELAEDVADGIARDLADGRIEWDDRFGPVVELYPRDTRSQESEILCL
jgi:hypothetical protein